jgi:hypothetical protein
MYETIGVAILINVKKRFSEGSSLPNSFGRNPGLDKSLIFSKPLAHSFSLLLTDGTDLHRYSRRFLFVLSPHHFSNFITLIDFPSEEAAGLSPLSSWACPRIYRLATRSSYLTARIS